MWVVIPKRSANSETAGGVDGFSSAGLVNAWKGMRMASSFQCVCVCVRVVAYGHTPLPVELCVCVIEFVYAYVVCVSVCECVSAHVYLSGPWVSQIGRAHV